MTKGNEPSPVTSGSKPGLVISAVGPDRAGIIRDFSSKIRAYGGNIEDTRMSKLGGEFALLMLVTGSEASLSEIWSAKDSLETLLGLHCFFKQTAQQQRPAGTSLRFIASGLDRPGIVESVSQVLAEKEVNVTSFLSRIENAPHTGTPMFVLEAETHLAEKQNASEVEEALAAACEREGLDFQVHD